MSTATRKTARHTQTTAATGRTREAEERESGFKEWSQKEIQVKKMRIRRRGEKEGKVAHLPTSNGLVRHLCLSVS